MIPQFGNENVIGEFVCDKVIEIDCDSVAPLNYETKEYIKDETCMTREELLLYAGFTRAYGWYISDLMIYDESKPLSDFIPNCRYLLHGECDGYDQVGCSFQRADLNPSDNSLNCVFCSKRMTRPPQSWCYVERC